MKIILCTSRKNNFVHCAEFVRADLCTEKSLCFAHFTFWAFLRNLCAENLCTGRISAESRRKKFSARDFLCRRGFFVR